MSTISNESHLLVYKSRQT